MRRCNLPEVRRCDAGQLAMAISFGAEVVIVWSLVFIVAGVIIAATMTSYERRNQRYYWASILGLHCRHRCFTGRCRFIAWHPGPHKPRVHALDRATRAERSIASDYRRAA